MREPQGCERHDIPGLLSVSILGKAESEEKANLSSILSRV